MVKTRIAPSPTGIPHIGTTRTALYNYVYAKKHGGSFILRIEDTDRARLVDEAEEKLLEILDWLGLSFDEKYIQSERLDIYKEHANQLVQKDLACDDGGAIRFKMPKEGTTSWTETVGNKLISFENKDQEDFIIIKSDGYPTYNFANVIDDHLMEITHVVRGQEFISSTPKHIQIYKAFGWEHPVLAHLPLVLGNDHQKLSKRHGAKSALDYRDDGYLPEAINNYMALLGWHPGGDKEVLSMDEMIQLFDLKDINTASPVFDPKKLEWMNGEYIRKSEISNLKSQILQHDQRVKKIDQKLLDQLVPLAQTRMTTLNDFYELTQFLIEPSDMEFTDQEKEIAKTLKEKLDSLPSWNEESVLAVMKEVLAHYSVKMSVLYRILTGSEKGLPLPQVVALLGKDAVLERL